MRIIWLGFVGAGIIVPYIAFLPWLVAHGPDVWQFWQDMFANRISSFFALDVIVSAIALITAAGYAQRQGGRGLWSVVGATLLVGVSAGLPLYLYFRLIDARQSTT